MSDWNQEKNLNNQSLAGKMAIADGIGWLLALPPHVNVNEIMIRPTGQEYP